MAARLHLVFAILAALAVWLPDQPEAQTSRQFGIQRTSVYISMPDGVRLAATVYTPTGLAPGERTSTVLSLTRYYRLVSVKPFWRWLFGSNPVTVMETHLRERLVKAGYSWVDVEVRGTGASFGTWAAPYDPDAIGDGATVLDWIVRQPWSSGRVAAVGTSYNAGFAVMQIVHDHPALKAVVSTFGLWDVGDIWPGGLRNTELIPPLARTFAELDRGDLGDFGWRARLFAGGVEPVDPSLLRDAQREHRGNINLDQFFGDLEFLDDPIRVAGSQRKAQLDAINPRVVVGRRSTVPVLTFSGWYDNAFSAGAIRQFLATRSHGSKVRIGPWIHGVGVDIANRSPYAPDSASRWRAHAEEVHQFLDRHLRGIAPIVDHPQPVQYYVVGEERWRGTETWPPAGGTERTYYLATSSGLSASAPGTGEAFDRYHEDFKTTSGGARWGFSMRSSRDRRFEDRRSFSGQLLHYTTAPLDTAATIIGAPLLELFVESAVRDGGLFVYLEDVAPNGTVRYVTEGQLRLMNRAWTGKWDLFGLEPLRTYFRSQARPMPPHQVESVVLRLLPIAYRIPAGHSIRVAIAGADASSFQPPLISPITAYDVHRDAAHPSRIALPVYADAAQTHDSSPRPPHTAN